MKKLISIMCTVCLLVFGFTISVFADTTSDNIPVIGITLNKTSDVLIVGETDTLTAVINPINATNKSITWVSSNPEAAAVDASGKITAISAGTAAITVTTTDGNKTAVCSVTVNAEPVIGVTLNKTSDVLTVGETDTLIATVSPTNATNKSVTWVSSNPKVLAADALGKITAISQGTAVITVTTADGNKTAVCNVTVKPQLVSGVTLNKTSDVLIIGETDNLTATVNPINATNKSVTWVSSNPKVLAVDESGKITAISQGTAVITVTTEDGNKTASCSVTVSAPSVSYSAHVQNIGWQNSVSNGQMAGTTGKSFRLEALKINLIDAPAGAVIKYQMHVQNIGWQAVVSNGMAAGTSGKSLRAEAIKIWLENLPGYSIQYKVHVENIGWQPWTENGCIAGTEGRSLRIEAIEIRVVKTVDIQYQVHVEKIGWKDNVSNGTITGTNGQP
ncbi:MAG: Ig-like domain-containing protein, partial [Clostridiaceae bacterium]